MTEDHQTILKNAKIIIADTEALNVDALTLCAAERIYEAIKNIIASDQILNGGKTAWERGVKV